MKISKIRLLASVAPLAAMLVAAPAYAQEEGAEGAEENGIEEIVVTAQRREENLQDVPISVSAFTGDQLKSQGASDISGLEGRVPGFTFGRSGVDPRPAMRGVRTENIGVNGDTTIGFFVDGVYQSRAQQALMGFLDLERVEVQRGPQGTLYGRNTFGGNISIQTARPDFDEYFGGADATVGNYGRFRLEGFVNAALSETVALRIAAALENSDGWVKNDNPAGTNLFDDESRYVRGALSFKPTENLTADFKFEFGKMGGAGASAFGYKQVGSYYYQLQAGQSYVGGAALLFNATPVIINARANNRDGVTDAIGGANSGLDLGVPLYQAGNAYRIDADFPTFLDTRSYGLASNIAYDFGSVTFKSITGYTDFSSTRTSDSDFSANTIAADYQRTAAKTFSQEIQLLSSDSTSPLTYVLGGYYFKDKLTGIFINQQLGTRTIRNVSPNIVTTAPAVGVGPGAFGGVYDQQRPETESVAAYAQASYAISDKLKLTGGIRYTEDTKDFRFANANSILPLSPGGAPQTQLITHSTTGIPASAFGVQGAPTNCTYTSLPPAAPGFQCRSDNTTVLTGATYRTAKFDKVTWRLGVDFQATPRNLIYASASTGFRSGGFNSGNAGAAAPTFQPETVLAFEVGSKNRFLDNTLQVNLSAYYNKYSSLQEQRQIPTGNTTISVIENSAKSRAYGAEAEILWQPTNELTIGSSLSYLNAKYTDYTTPLPFGTSLLIADPTATTATIVNGITYAGIGQRRLFAPGYDCGPIAGTGGAGQPAVAFACDLSGKSIPYAPKYSGSVYAQYDIDLGSAGTLSPYAMLTFSGSWFGQPANSILEKQRAFSKLDLRLTWALNEKISLQGFVTNVTDKQTATRFVYGGNPLQASYAPPRQWGGRVSFKF
jgi:iron complex outermembrane recepter protein